ncbi:hypothetical protein [Vibrio sp. 10N.261.55.A7]|uniref:hypothetical protein n=1 Tax=Vibrio sp. 10N.261.55.A7 TaxID=1880851 RepID=UPI000C8242BF|nr:hypothetical protein [Vibrio sp. 10N.261.55.A7]PMK00719.1 hypothetical protein BCU12_19930 [Vibrio sp. 10N.261.55.A7]
MKKISVHVYRNINNENTMGFEVNGVIYALEISTATAETAREVALNIYDYRPTEDINSFALTDKKYVVYVNRGALCF